ncbi:4-hydroxybenzoate polyprenyltransferase [Antricoccus suffuscus]|uniref:4-hydroxybenzoate polyprenyltransferase n=1 Tax=Antricoccus suffuscus TaxID=1629062 RepID=A0A2T1A341_9ACTN|nr:UbiA family prenyltransferase [Antricoccus suffuscus]PRZ43029.1 4-hydroxybenzoate polyprenyltransferase [Antricoccus suffuscus]
MGRSLLLSCHPIPTLAVTVIATVLTAVTGNSIGTCALVALAVLTGQLSIGWSNDLIDARRDRAAGRTDKPVARGAISRRSVIIAITASVILTVPLALGLGWRAGLVQLAGTAAGWAYNFGIKSTVLSPAPYVVAFGGLPAIATLALPGGGWPPWWALVAGALLGVSAHFGNVLPDIDEDAAAGVHGLPHRIGRLGSAVAASGSVLVAVAVVVLGRGSTPTPVDWGGLVAAAILAAAGFWRARRDHRSEAAFLCTVGAAAVCVVLIAISGALR